jgi:acyl-CoA-binding protein
MASSTTLLCTAVVLLVGTRALIGGDRGTAVTAVAAPKHRHPYLSLRLRGGSGAPGYGPLNVGTPQGDASDRLLDPEFLAAAAYARQLPGLSAEDKLTFYGLYKQATVGVCNVPRPSRFAWGETAKWQHWHGHGDMDPVVAARKYVEHLDSMQPEWRTSVHPPQFENMGADGEDSSVHLSSSSEREADTPSWFRDQTSRRDSSSGDSPWEEDGEGERTAERGGKGDKDEADTQAGMLRMHQRMRLMAPTVPPSGKGIPELGLRPVHEEHADQLRYAELMDMLVLQHQGKYVAALEENGEEINAFLRHFYERLVNVSNLVPYKIPARNLSLTGQELEEAKKERAYLWQILTSDIDLPVANASSPDDIIDQRFEAEDCMVEQWLCLRDRYVSLMGQIGDFQITSGPEGEGERGPSLPDGSTPRTEAELAKAARRAARDEVKRHKLEVELMLNADVMLWAVSGTASRRPCDGSFGRCEVLKVGTLVEGEYSEIERDWMTGSRQRFHRGQEAMSWARVAAGRWCESGPVGGVRRVP